MILISELVVDSFAGGGGASHGIEKALGRPIDFAINHDREAIALHTANHPNTKHFCEDVWDVDPLEVTGGKPVGLAWFSPDCKHFSKAKGGKPVSKKIRGLAWIVIRWAKIVKPRVIMLENVSEFATWGPLNEDGTPCKIRKGFTFRRWCKMLQNLGYQIDMREMSACDYGAPTTRRRLFIIARCDGKPIVWPEETHGPGLKPFRTAAECIDFSIPCQSIFDRKKPLADATLRRIARGITRYVINNPKPFIVQMRGTDDSQINCSARPAESPLGTVSAGGIHHALVTPLIASLAHGDSGGRREYPINDPLGTVSAGGIQHALITPIIAGVGGRMGQSPERSVDRPLQTITAKADSAVVSAELAPFITKFRTGSTGSRIDEPLHTITAGGDMKRPAGAAHAMGLVTPVIMPITHSGERCMHSPADPLPTITCSKRGEFALVAPIIAPLTHQGERRSHSANEPLPTVTGAHRGELALIAPTLINTRNGERVGQAPRVRDILEPAPTVTAKGSQGAVVAAFLARNFGGHENDGSSMAKPMHTVTAKDHHSLVHAFLVKYYGNEKQDPRLENPLGTLTTKDRFALVTVEGEQYYIVDIRMRMLVPRELFNAQSFSRDYKIDPIVRGKPLTKTAQVRMAGNSVCPVMAEALVKANVVDQVEVGEAEVA